MNPNRRDDDVSDFDAPVHVVRALVAAALAEDIGPLGDLTASLVPADARAAVDVVARAQGVLAGTASSGCSTMATCSPRARRSAKCPDRCGRC
jgi:nicotinate-nucleotide pyrophosphorylase